MTTVFIAASYRWKRLARQWATMVETLDVEVSSSWHALPDTAECDPEEDGDRLRLLQANLADIHRADCLLVLAYAGEPRATFAELGYALACGKPVVCVHLGPVGRQLFDSHPKAVRLDADDRVGPIAMRLRSALREAVTR